MITKADLGKAIGDAMHFVTEPWDKLTKWIQNHSPMHSPAAEGPLSTMPDFTYYADAIRLAIPHVRAASRDLMNAASLGGGELALSTSAAAARASVGAAGAGSTVINLGGITIQGGTFTDRKSIEDLAESVSEHIMHKVRMQGGLLPQM